MHGPRYPFSRSGLEFLATGSWPQLPSDRPADRLSSCRSAWAPCSTPLSLRRLGTAVHRDAGMEMALDQAGDDDAGCVAVDWAGLLRQAQPTRPLWLAGWLAGWLVRALPPPRRRPRRCSGRAASFSSAFTHLVALSPKQAGACATRRVGRLSPLRTSPPRERAAAAREAGVEGVLEFEPDIEFEFVGIRNRFRSEFKSFEFKSFEFKSFEFKSRVLRVALLFTKQRRRRCPKFGNIAVKHGGSRQFRTAYFIRSLRYAPAPPKPVWDLSIGGRDRLPQRPGPR